jgi:purine-binding chemotaxis protein CheW
MTATRTHPSVLHIHDRGQLCGIPVLQVRDELASLEITPIPLAPPAVAGSLNRRGRIVTSVDLRVRLVLPPRGQLR